MSNIDWSRGTSTTYSDSSDYHYRIVNEPIADRIRAEDQMRYEREMRPDQVHREIKEVTLELKKLKAERVIKENPIKEEEEKQIFFDPKELDI